MTHTNQLFGRLVCTANGAHIIRSMKKIEKLGGPIPVKAPTGDNSMRNDTLSKPSADPIMDRGGTFVSNAAENVGVSRSSVMTHNMPSIKAVNEKKLKSQVGT